MPKTLFVSYSHRDEKHKDYVVGHLGVAEQQGFLELWDDRRIKGGGAWRQEIDTALARADVAILLVSHHSLTSTFILDEEVSAMLKRRDREGLVVYPIIIRACDWEAVDWLRAMNLRPTDGKPLARYTLDRRDEVMAGICKEIRGLLENGSPSGTPEKLAPSPVDDEIDRLVQQTDALSAELGTTQAALNSMFEILAEKQVPVEQLETKLHAIAERHVELTKLWQVLPKSNDDPAITSRREQAAAALEEGEYDQAAELLEEARSIMRQAREEHQDALDRALNAEASILSQQGELERSRLNYRKAADYFAEAASLVPTSDPDARFDCLTKQASVLHEQGREFGDNLALRDAVRVCRLMLKEFARERVPLQWASAQNNLGTALSTLGEHETGTKNLQAAVQAFHAALEERTRERVPLDWAETQNNLGTALQTLGEREIGKESLQAAIQAFHAALEERNRERVPLDWAMTQNNIGTALSTLGERETGKESLEAAVQAYHAALQEWTRERVPLLWATTQNNLGVALSTLGERETGTENLEAAVQAYHAALKERTRERVPLDWAMTQNNLGAALQTLGDRESGTESLEAAVEALHVALEERTRERVPLDWAMTQGNLGGALQVLGECVGRKDYLEIALTCMKNASEVYLQEAGQMHHEADFEERISAIKAAIARLS